MPALGKQTQNAQIRARLDRIAHMNVTFIRRVLPRRPICQQLRLRINVQRRAKTFGQIIQRGIFKTTASRYQTDAATIRSQGTTHSLIHFSQTINLKEATK